MEPHICKLYKFLSPCHLVMSTLQATVFTSLLHCFLSVATSLSSASFIPVTSCISSIHFLLGRPLLLLPSPYDSIIPLIITIINSFTKPKIMSDDRTDGVLCTLIRIGAAATDEDKRWYMFDGPVDAVWIESMNTVLDDNKKLCLSSGEIIKLTEVRSIMELGGYRMLLL